MSIFNNLVKVVTIVRASTHCVANNRLEDFSILDKLSGSFLVERVGRIWFKKEKLEANKDGIYAENRFPVLAQNVETDMALKINVGMINALGAQDFRRLVGEIGGD